MDIISRRGGIVGTPAKPHHFHARHAVARG
jgi:hypothetical protein